jgi:hypothetical protein
LARSLREKVLLYHFQDSNREEQIRQTLHALQIPVQVLPDDAWAQKIGYLLGLKGFQLQDMAGDGFSFPHEVMLLHNIKNKRLDQVLRAFHEAHIAPIRYKAVVTPFNTLWTLRRLCETMQKEHAAMAMREAKNESNQ